ncbi:hypothetical protein AB0D42_06650 [Streptomyces sp. NPDC048304]|jgi:YcxB-like protein|uniref:hypothetical protein n=1 Tax=Streptomyces sp. NPDC048304 TaxID=3154820 RepID=UPI00340C7D06
MVMDMGRETAHEAVELAYRPTARDFTKALWVRRRMTWWGRNTLGVALALLLWIGLLATDGMDVTSVLLVGYLALCFLLMPRFQGRSLARAAEVSGACRTTVTDAGVTIRGDHITVTQEWGARPCYRETPEMFVLFSGDPHARCLTLLPKRGLAESSDADRLREILDRHITRT